MAALHPNSSMVEHLSTAGLLRSRVAMADPLLSNSIVANSSMVSSSSSRVVTDGLLQVHHRGRAGMASRKEVMGHHRLRRDIEIMSC